MRPRRERLGWSRRRPWRTIRPGFASMRPRRERLGWAAMLGCSSGMNLHASMRPRRERLGWLRADDHAARSCCASMRPRRERLGWSPPTLDRSASRDLRFNEAEARAPRMGQPGRRSLALRSRPSMRPRRERLGWAAVPRPRATGDRAASMRPRRERLGWRSPRAQPAASRQRASMRPRRERLGWARSNAAASAAIVRRFNEAEARAPRMAWRRVGRRAGHAAALQ